MISSRITVDYHIHCGQYYDNYYQPATIIKCLYKNGIKTAWLSSTTSCVEWKNQEEKQYILEHIDDEIAEAVFAANKYGINLFPLYWVIPQRHLDGESVKDVMHNSLYKGFKVHTRVGAWNEDNDFSNRLMEEICLYASNYKLPVLIHTGTDFIDSPARFETFFKKYCDVKFVLAHCKDAESIIDIFQKYKNVCGDTAFCPKENYDKICLAGFKERMQIGTDFPITHWFGSPCKRIVSLRALSNNYNKICLNCFVKRKSD